MIRLMNIENTDSFFFIQWFVLSKDRVEIRIEMGSERVENGFEQRVYGFKQTGT